MRFIQVQSYEEKKTINIYKKNEEREKKIYLVEIKDTE